MRESPGKGAMTLRVFNMSEENKPIEKPEEKPVKEPKIEAPAAEAPTTDATVAEAQAAEAPVAEVKVEEVPATAPVEAKEEKPVEEPRIEGAVNKGDFILMEMTGRAEETGEVFDTTSEDTAKEKGTHKEGNVYGPRL